MSYRFHCIVTTGPLTCIMHNEPLIALDNVTCYALDSISKLWTPIGEGLIVYGCTVIQINSLKCIVEERERERERGREIDTRTGRQANRQADSDRVRECVQLGCRVSLMTKPTTVTSMIKQRNQTSNEPNVGKTSSEESRERESPERVMVTVSSTSKWSVQ